MYIVKESPLNTNKPARLYQDITQVFSLTEVPLEWKDHHRLGKFNKEDNKPRPILLTFLKFH